MSDETIATQRLDLVSMTPAFLETFIAGDHAAAERLLGFQIPADLLDDMWLLRWRLDQVSTDPAFMPWLPRAVGLRESGTMIGHLNFHTPPDPDYLRDLAPNAIEFGYGIFESYRRRGYAQEAVQGLMEWTSRVRGINRFVLSISPENAASLRIAHNLGFAKIGQHVDEEDGPEDIFERKL